MNLLQGIQSPDPFVVTLNDKPLGMQVLPVTPRKEAVLKAVDEVLRQSLGQDTDISVTFVSPEDLRIFNGGLKLDELPRSWAHYALTLEPVLNCHSCLPVS